MVNQKSNTVKLSPVQQKIVDLLKSDPKAYIEATRFWDFQHLFFSDGRKPAYFKKRTREVLAEKGIIVEYEPSKYRLTAEAK